MDYHLTRRLRLHTEPKHDYSWAIQEIDEQGKQIGDDQIPCPDTRLFHFIATSCVLCDSIYISPQQSQDTPPPSNSQQSIHVRLRPGCRTFSMFGTDRAIKIFDLDIRPILKPAEQERCGSFGYVSFTVDMNHTQDDCIRFYLVVKPDTFARYAAKIAQGSVDEITFSVQSVDGFYSDWNPFSTDKVKVLTDGGEQKIALPSGLEFEPPRLGHIPTASLYINRRLEFGKGDPEPDIDEKVPDLGSEPVVPEAQAPPAMDAPMLLMLQSVKRAAWFVMGLLTLIFIELLRR
jgi:hypothetical protein